jgi:hypothetical protein
VGGSQGGNTGSKLKEDTLEVLEKAHIPTWFWDPSWWLPVAVALNSSGCENMCPEGTAYMHRSRHCSWKKDSLIR